MKRTIARQLAAVGMLAGATLFSSVAPAATFTVTTLSDGVAGSLRNAIDQANLAAGADNVVFAPGLTGTITLTSGQIPINGPLAITGPGASSLTIDGGANSRIFSVFATDAACPAPDGPDYLVSISGLRLLNAHRNADSPGGAIFTQHSLSLDSVIVEGGVARSGGGVAFLVQYPGQALTITNSQFLNNIARPLEVVATALSDSGGAVSIFERCSGTNTTPVPVTISNSVFSGNRVQPVALNGYGGAIASDSRADISITDTRIVNNQVNAPNPPVANQIYRGGGIFAHARSLTILRSEIADNAVTDATASDVARGGGLHLFNNAADLQGTGDVMTVKLINSTVSGNASAATAGAMHVYGNVAVEIDNSTVSSNTVPTTRTGGILINTGATNPSSASNATAPTLTVASSILANNAGDGGDVASNVTNIPSFTINATRSLIEKLCPSPTCEITVAGNGNLITVDPLLGPLAFNGGSSRTHAVLAGSAVLDNGSNPLALPTDQRGAGFVRVFGAAADMGAFEYTPAVAPVLASVVSRRVHGAAGTFDLPLGSVATNPTTEPRQGPAFTLVYTFNKAVTAGTAQVSAGTATAGAPTFSGAEMRVPLTGVTNQQYVTVVVSNVTAADGGSGGSGSIRVGFLLGDVNQTRVVTLSDLGQVNAQVAQFVTAANYLKDVNVSGTLSLADKGITNTQVTKALPAP